MFSLFWKNLDLARHHSSARSTRAGVLAGASSSYPSSPHPPVLVLGARQLLRLVLAVFSACRLESLLRPSTVLNQKFEDLQAQMNGLEKRNKECYEQLLVRDNKGQDDDDNSGYLEKKGKNSDGIALEIQLHMQRLSRRFKWKEDIAGKDCKVKKKS